MATPRRDEAKPGESRTVTGVLPSAATHRCASSTTAGEVAPPVTISMSSDAGTGLKKCRPRNRPGWLIVAARSSIDIDEVLLAITAPEVTRRSMRASEATLTP